MDVISQGPIYGDHFIQPHALSVDDSLYRNMYTYHRIINKDTDEVIVATNYSNVIAKSNCCMFFNIFITRYIFRPTLVLVKSELNFLKVYPKRIWIGWPIIKIT